MVTVYIKEFIAICDYLEKCKVRQKHGCYIVDRTELENMLDRNKFAPAKEKLQSWKRLNWTKTDEERLTKRFYQNGKYVPFGFINIGVHKELKRLWVEKKRKEG